jgi:hypothetical protein
VICCLKYYACRYGIRQSSRLSDWGRWSNVFGDDSRNKGFSNLLSRLDLRGYLTTINGIGFFFRGGRLQNLAKTHTNGMMATRLVGWDLAPQSNLVSASPQLQPRFTVLRHITHSASQVLSTKQKHHILENDKACETIRISWWKRHCTFQAGMWFSRMRAQCNGGSWIRTRLPSSALKNIS